MSPLASFATTSVATATSRSWQLPGPPVNRYLSLTLLAVLFFSSTRNHSVRSVRECGRARKPRSERQLGSPAAS
eukprot:13729581-Heterocapsa_arctica.AAC.1